MISLPEWKGDWMKSIIFEQFGNPKDVLQIQEVPIPKPKWGEVLVRMIASPINPSDLLYIEGRYGVKLPLPATPGFEGVGVVEKSGGGLFGWFRKGKRVAVINDRAGNWQEYTVVPSKQVVPIPSDISDEQAASFFVNPVTVLVMTQYVLRIPKDAWLLQSAAGGALGKMIIRLGKHYGFRTVNIVRRADQFQELKSLGADECIHESDSSISDRVLAITQGKGVPFAIDAVGGKTGSKVVESLAPNGRALLYGLLSGEPICIDPRFLIGRNSHVEGFWLSHWAKSQTIPTMLGVFRRVKKLIRSRILTTNIGKSFSLDQIGDAVQEAATPGKGGKVLLKISAK
jgi:NADPH:quinone reductase